MSAQNGERAAVGLDHWSWMARAAAGLVAPGGARALGMALDGAAVGEGSRVLELQAGVGIGSRRILERNPRTWVGLDSDPLVVALLERGVGGPGRQARSAPPEATGLEAEAVTAVVMEGLLSTLDDGAAVEVLAECGRVLRRSGRVAAVEVSPGPEAEAAVVDDLARGGLRARDGAALRTLVERAGLTVVGVVSTLLDPADPAELARAAGPRAADPRTMLGVARAVADGAVRSAATVARQALERHAVNLRATVVVAERPLVAGVGRSSR